MFADAKREGCGIAWNHKLLCFGQMKTAASLFHQQRPSLVHLDLNPVEKLVVSCLTFSPGVLWKQTCMSSKLCRFLFTLNCAMKFSGDPPSNNCKTFVFQTKRLATFFSEACRPAFCSALGKNLLIWFLQSGDSV